MTEKLDAEQESTPNYSNSKEDQLVIIGAFFEDLEVWQGILDDCATFNVSISNQYLSHHLKWVHFQLSIGGDWHQLAKIETNLKTRKKALSAGFLDWKRDVFRLDDTVKLPYVFEANAIVGVALFDLLIHFIRAEKLIEIKEVMTERYLQGKTAVPMQRIRVTVWVPYELNLPELRENFMIFCEQYNFDGMFELDRS